MIVLTTILILAGIVVGVLGMMAVASDVVDVLAGEPPRTWRWLCGHFINPAPRRLPRRHHDCLHETAMLESAIYGRWVSESVIEHMHGCGGHSWRSRAIDA
jgi:hypothetical protein